MAEGKKKRPKVIVIILTAVGGGISCHRIDQDHPGDQ